MAFGREGTRDTGWNRPDSTQTPHWMRLLEEKYQRLHTKIVNQSARFTFKRSSNLVHGHRGRRFKEARQAGKQLSTDKKFDGDYSSVQQQDQKTDEVCRDEINEAKSLNRLSESCAKIDDSKYLLNSAGKLDCARVQALRTKSKTQWPVSRDSPPVTSKVNCFENEQTISSQCTPWTSGTVTRVSSALALTRLSSEIAISPRPNIEERSYSVEQASQLRLALNSHFGTRVDSECKHDVHDNTASLHCDNHSGAAKINISEDEDDNSEDDTSVKCQTERQGMEISRERRRRRASRAVKTSISRVSHKTTKSCPATFWGSGEPYSTSNDTNHIKHDSDGNKNSNNNKKVNKGDGHRDEDVPESVLPLTSKGIREGRLRVFARMSLEARHAIDETLKEMRGEEEEISQDYANRDLDSPETTWPNDNSRHFNRSNSMNNNISNSMNNNNNNSNSMNNNDSNSINVNIGNNIQDNTSIQNTMSGLGEDREPVAVDEDSRSTCGDSVVSIPSNCNIPCASRMRNERTYMTDNVNTFVSHGNSRKDVDFSDAAKMAGRKLPQLGHAGVSMSSGFPNPHARLPDIGQQYPPFRETTFEITPPDFDIRFHQIITCNQGDRETPPLDIRQQSIEKCQQWLVRYTPRR